MTTEMGVFWWDGGSIYDRRAMQETGDAFRAWGWLEDAVRAQRFQTQGNAMRAAHRLYAELRRLYRVRLAVVEVEINASHVTGETVFGIFGIGEWRLSYE
jgi:hypothetical protein